MSKAEKAEQRALEAYPVKEEWVGNQYGSYGDVNERFRGIYQEGYHQAEKDLELSWEDMDKGKVITTDMLANGTDYIVDSRLRFEDGRLYITRIPHENGIRTDFPEMVDVTEDVLDALLKALEKRREAAYKSSIINQLKKGL